MPYYHLGCWKDEKDERALTNAEGGSSFLDGAYPYRENAIAKCFKTAISLGHMIFALQDGGQCFTEEPGQNPRKYGRSSNCSDDGEGGPMANDVYEEEVL